MIGMNGSEDEQMDILEKVRESIEVMRRYKRSNRLIDTLEVVAVDDVFEELKKTGVMSRNKEGKYFLDGVLVTRVCGGDRGYPNGYFAVQ